MDEYLEAVEERRVLDERDSRRLSRRGTSDTPVASAPSTPGMRTPGDGRRYMFTPNGEDFSRPGSRAGFRRPGEADDTPVGGRLDQLRRTESTRPRGEKISTPIPSVFTPQLQRSSSGYPFPADFTSTPPLSLADLNRLQAKVLRAKLTDAPDVDQLEEEYEFERMRYEAGSGADAGMYGTGNGEIGRRTEGEGKGEREVVTQILPTLDGSGRLYDVGLGGEGGEERKGPGNKRKKVEKVSEVSVLRPGYMESRGFIG